MVHHHACIMPGLCPLRSQLYNRMSKKILNNNIQEYRQKKELTQEGLADLVGVSRQTIISIEKGNYVPSLELAFSFSKVFKVSVEKLFEY